MFDNSDDIKYKPNEANNDSNIVDSDSDLFGESDSASDKAYDDKYSSFNILKDADDISTHRDASSYINKDLNADPENINEIKLQEPVKCFGIDNSDRVLITLKLPERLKVLNNIDENEIDNEMAIKGGFDSEGGIHSNSKLVSWSDGTYSLLINNELAYDCIFGDDKAFIFDDANDQKYKVCLGRVDKKFTIRPRVIEKNRLLKDSRSRVMVPTTLEEINQHEVETRKRVDELNAISSIRNQQKKTSLTSESNRKQMTSYFLEESSEESA